MQVKVEISSTYLLQQIYELGKDKQRDDAYHIINTLENEISNIETRMKNAEKELLTRREPLACGETIYNCLYCFSLDRGWLDEDPEFKLGDELEKSEVPPELTWGYSFCAGGTYFKGAGCRIPGGYILLWWK